MAIGPSMLTNGANPGAGMRTDLACRVSVQDRLSHFGTGSRTRACNVHTIQRDDMKVRRLAARYRRAASRTRAALSIIRQRTGHPSSLPGRIALMGRIRTPLSSKMSICCLKASTVVWVSAIGLVVTIW